MERRQDQATRPRHVLITGASSGIGHALALHYAKAGMALTLLGRDATRLAATADACRQGAADVATAMADVTDADAMRDLIESSDQRQPIDLLIANAGISGGSPGGARAIMAVNVTGVVNTVEPALSRMLERGRGQIALMASLAGFRPMPQAPAYGASKSAVIALGRGLRLRHRGDGLKINTICPGFIETPLVAVNRFPMPFLMAADDAARVIARGLERDRPIIAFPAPMVVLARIASLLPDGLIGLMTRGLPAKE